MLDENCEDVSQSAPEKPLLFHEAHPVNKFVCEAKGNGVAVSKRKAFPEGLPKVDMHDTTRGCVDEDISEVSVAYTKRITKDGVDGHAEHKGRLCVEQPPRAAPELVLKVPVQHRSPPLDCLLEKALNVSSHMVNSSYLLRMSLVVAS